MKLTVKQLLKLIVDTFPDGEAKDNLYSSIEMLANKKYIDLPALVSQQLTDIYALSANGAGSFKETREQLTQWMSDNVQILPDQVAGLVSNLDNLQDEIDDFTLQQSYNQQSDGGLNLIAGKSLILNSTEAAFRLPAMTNPEFSAISDLGNGQTAWSTDDNRSMVNTGTAESPAIEKVAYLSDIAAIEEDAIYGESYFVGNSTPTNIVTMGVPVKINGTYVSGELSGFTQSGGTLTYTEATPRTVLVSATLTATYDGSSNNTSFYIALNGTVVAKSQQSTFIGGVTPATQSNPVKALVTLEQDGEIEVWTSNDDGTDDIIVQDINFTANSIGGLSVDGTVALQDAYDNGNVIDLNVSFPFQLQSSVDEEPTVEVRKLNVLNPTVPCLVDYKKYQAYDAGGIGFDAVTERVAYWDKSSSASTYSKIFALYEGGASNVQKDYFGLSSKYRQNEFYRPVTIQPAATAATVVQADPSSCFDVVSTTLGTRPAPPMTTTQRNAIASPANGLLVYDTTIKCYFYYDGSAWQSLLPSETAINGMTIGSTSGISSSSFISSFESRVGDVVMGIVEVQFTPSAGSSTILLIPSFSSFSGPGQANGTGDVRKTTTPAPGQAMMGVIDSVSGQGLELNPVVITTGVAYRARASFSYRVV